MHWKVTNDFVWFSLWCVCEWSAYCFQCAFDVTSLHLWLFGSCFSHTVSISLLCPLFILHLCTVTGSLIPPPFTTFRLWRPRYASVYRLVFLTFSVYHLCASRPSFIVCFVVVVCFGLVWSFSFRFAPVQSIHSSFFKWFFHVEALPFLAFSLCICVGVLQQSPSYFFVHSSSSLSHPGLSLSLLSFRWLSSLFSILLFRSVFFSYSWFGVARRNAVGLLLL